MHVDGYDKGPKYELDLHFLIIAVSDVIVNNDKSPQALVDSDCGDYSPQSIVFFGQKSPVKEKQVRHDPLHMRTGYFPVKDQSADKLRDNGEVCQDSSDQERSLFIH